MAHVLMWLTHQLAAFPSHGCTPREGTGLWRLRVSLYEQLECVGFGALKLTSVFIWSPLWPSLFLHL